MSRCIIIGCPDTWSDTQVTMLAERLMQDALPQSVGVATTDAGGIEVPLIGTYPLRATNHDD